MSKEFVNLGPGLWTLFGEWEGSAFARRLTLCEVETGWIVHNAFDLSVEQRAHLLSIAGGEEKHIVGIIVPNRFHGSDARAMSSQFRNAKVFVPKELQAKLANSHRVDGSIELDWPADWSQALPRFVIQGQRYLSESVFVHRPSKTLILTDLAFNMNPARFNGRLEKRVMAWNRVGQGFGPSWICDHLFTADLAKRNYSLGLILEENFERIIVNHGEIVESDGKQVFATGFRL